MSPREYQVTRYQPGEETELYALYLDTTHIVNGRHYTQQQCERWAPQNKDMAEWTARIHSRNPFVAREVEKIPGFGELEADGHIDYFYVHHQWQRHGVGTSLYRAIEEEARLQGIPVLYLESSVTAKTFFVRMGFEITEKEENVVCGTPGVRFWMKKRLAQ